MHPEYQKCRKIRGHWAVPAGTAPAPAGEITALAPHTHNLGTMHAAPSTIITIITS